MLPRSSRSELEALNLSKTSRGFKMVDQPLRYYITWATKTMVTDDEHRVKGLLAEAITSMVSEDRAIYRNRLKARFLHDLEKKRQAKH